MEKNVAAVVPVSNLLRKRAEAAAPEAGFVPNLADYDWIAVSSSGGKDSHAMLDYVVELARDAGVLDRVVVIHADLGRVEWEGTGELVEKHAAYYGLRLEVVSRIGGVAKTGGATYKPGEVFGDLLDYAERRGAWPSSNTRWCTSEFKRGPILKAFTALAKEWKAATGEKRPCRILDCMGLRAEESPARAKKVAFARREETRTKVIDSWLPIHHWLEGHVWTRVKASGVEWHRAYDLGMPRLSCAFCIFAPKAALVLAGRHNRDLLDAYVDVEARINHKFRMDLSLADVKAAVLAGDNAGPMDGNWGM